MKEKPTVVMVHGGPSADHTVSKPYFGQLMDIAQVVYDDHRGNGRSSGDDPKDWTLSQWGDDLRWADSTSDRGNFGGGRSVRMPFA